MAKKLQNSEIIPSLVVGVGGTGYRVLKHLKRKFYESAHYKQKVPPMIKFYSFDTDANIEDNKDEDILTTGEKINLVCQTDKVLTNLNQFPYIKQWFPAHRIKDTVAHGARQIRALGRLALFTNINTVTDSLRNGIRAITEKKLLQGGEFSRTPDNVPVNVFIVGSVCGGTGSGMITDIAYIVQELIRREALITPETQGYIFLPDAIVDVADSELERIKANGAAALKELDLFMENMEKFNIQYSDDFYISDSVGMSKPMSFCYLVEGEGIDSQNTIELVTAEQIFHSIGTEITKDQKSYLSNVPTNAFKAIASGEFIGKKTNYSAFGVSSCIFPAPKIIDIFSNQFSADMMDAILDWANPKEENEENPWLKEVKNFQNKNKLLFDSSGTLKLLDDIIKINTFKKLTMSKYSDVNVSSVGDLIFQDLSKSKKSYEKVKDELEEREIELAEKLSNSLIEIIKTGMGHPFMGCRFLIKFLENIEMILDECSETLEDNIEELEKRKKMFLSASNRKKLSLEEESQKSWFFRNKQLARSYAEEWIESQNKAYGAQMEVDRRNSAINILSKFRDMVSNNLNSLKSFTNMTETLENKFRKKSVSHHVSVNFSSSDSDWLLNRSIVDGEDLERMYKNHVGTAHDFEHIFIGKDGINLPEQWTFFKENPVIFEQKIREYSEKLLKEKIEKITIEDFLLEKSEFTGDDEIRKMGEALAETGTPLWKLDKYLYTEKTVPVNLLGVYDAENTKVQEHVESILQADNQSVTTKDPHRITLVQSEHGAPLFALSKIEEWEIKYNKYKYTEFLHAITEEELKLKWEDFPFRPITIDKKEGIRYFTLGDALGFIQAIKVDDKTRYYATLTPEEKVDIHNKANDFLGTNRFDAFDNFIKSQAIRKMKRHIEKKLDSIGSYEKQQKLVMVVKSKLESFVDRMPDDDRKTLVKEEIKSLAKVIEELGSKIKSDEIESGFIG